MPDPVPADTAEQAAATLPAYVRGDDYLYLRCGGCNGILVIVESGTSLREMNEAHADHECEEDDA